MPARLPEHLQRSSAERARDWRASRKRAGHSAGSGKSGKSGKHASQFERGEFVAVDGEGFSEGETLEWRVGVNETHYTGKRHFYALLSASDGSEIYAPFGRLGTQECLDFLLAIRERNANAILVCFGGSYDVMQMLAHGLSRDQLARLTKGEGLSVETHSDARASRKYLDVSFGAHDYRLEYRPRKSFTVMRWPTGAKKYAKNKRGVSVLTKCDKATLWDVWGFFQDSFAGVMRKWVPDHPDYQFIARMKGERNIFERHEIAEIRRYNQAELRCLVAIMDKLRGAVERLGLKLQRWDGAGAIAAAMNKLHSVRDHKREAPDDVFLAARHAYSGGHIEACQIGYYDGDVHHYDINSAYPAEFADLPSLANGYWRHGKSADVPAGFTVVRIKWRFHDGASFYPLFFREHDGGIVYPYSGEGWYWFPEYDAAREYAASFGAAQFEAVEWWHFVEDAPVRPFGWVRDYYTRRQQLVAETKQTGIDTGEEKIIKLGLNSLYGKTAQQVGARYVDGAIQPPAYFQLEWAGYVTSGCRAKLMRAAILNMPAIISFATDGLFATAPLDLDCPKEKVLGAWDYQVHNGITIVMPGVYWLYDDGKKPQHYSRGFDKQQMSDAEFVHRAWQRKERETRVEQTRLIGLGTAVGSDAFWDMRGMFVRSTRRLQLDGDNSKRFGIMLYKSKPHRGLVPTIPRHQMEAGTFGNDLSAPYPIAWLSDGAPSDDDLLAMEEDRETLDAELA